MEAHMANRDAASNIEMPGESSAPVAAGRYFQLALLVCAAGAIYPMLYKGLAIGVISLPGYSPDVFLPLLNGWLTTEYSGMQGYQLYFGYIACMSAIGGGACLLLRHMLGKRAAR
ncbi:hypothetical protein WT27_04095 [Burkholderia territorii]|uniref:MFS transporter n=2 Tax=Burkholderia territorii TaxID=1503055 RepID=A0A106DCN7_9BURK|nr:hypothetical protein WT27_04095 [Burkholderia territorii]KVX26756.1 hypothetical protein WT31_15855 [Burkholderia territorii]